MKGCYIIVRGPAASGKSTLSKKLAEHLGARLIEFDEIRIRNNLKNAERYRIKANEIAIPEARKYLESGEIVVFDDTFFFESQITHLIENLPYEHYVFTLKTPVEVVLKRNSEREKNIPEKWIRAAHRKVSEFDVGIVVDNTEKKLHEVLEEVLTYLPKNVIKKKKKGVGSP